MTVTTIGDLAQTFKQRTVGNRLHRDLGTLNFELTTGLKRDVAKAVGGNTGPVASIERALTHLEAQSTAVKEASIFAGATGIALSAMSTRIEGIDLGAMTITHETSALQIDGLAKSARIAFVGMISDLGTQTAGRPLFGGASGNAQVTRGAEDIMADLVSSLAGATSAKDIKDGVTAYFADGGPFQTKDYVGVPVDLAPFDLGDGSRVEVGVRADDPAIREALAEVARIAVLGEGLPVSHEARADVLSGGVTGLLQGQNKLIGLEAGVGLATASIDDAKVRIGTERNGFELARLDLLAADPYDTAIRLKQTENQISMIYTLTARLSELSLVSYLR
ncbi:hypothetical protein [Palleronia sp.]|uniref:hypothetical protein n=1 Tax=Palleronia sp. TaxID=1940284 RepID=UPI0035C833F3